MQKNDIKNNTFSNPSPGMFVSMDELNNMNFLEGKQKSNGELEFSNTKQWTKSMKDIETEQRSNQQIISEIIKLEEKINTILKMLESFESNNVSINKENIKILEKVVANNSTWKDKLKGIVR